jgi:hypothetical protein
MIDGGGSGDLIGEWSATVHKWMLRLSPRTLVAVKSSAFDVNTPGRCQKLHDIHERKDL